MQPRKLAASSGLIVLDLRLPDGHGLPQRVQQRQAVTVGQPQVEHDQVRLAHRRQHPRAGAVTRQEQRDVGPQPQQLLHQLHVGLVVLDAQHAAGDVAARGGQPGRRGGRRRRARRARRRLGLRSIGAGSIGAGSVGG